MLLCGYINNVKKVVKRKSLELDVSILWLSNTLRLLHTLKQYSGEAIFQEENTPTQNAQCLQNFDLYEYRQVLSDQAVNVYQVENRYFFKKKKQSETSFRNILHFSFRQRYEQCKIRLKI